MDNSSKQPLKLQEVLSHCSHKAKRIKKISRSTRVFAKPTKAQSEKVHRFTNKAAAVTIPSDFSNTQNNLLPSEPTIEIQSKLQELFSNFPNDDAIKVDPHCSTSSHQTGLPEIISELRLPVLPTAFDCSSCDEMCNDDASDCESDFYPDWSSVDSCTSSMESRSGRPGTRWRRQDKNEVFLNDEDLLKLSDEDYDYPAYDDNCDLIPMDQGKPISQSDLCHNDGYGKGEDEFTICRLPVPVCGNDVPGTSTQSPEKTTSMADNHVMKPQALRRVKSMVIENDLDDGVEVGKRMLVFQQKRNITSMTSQPSPLLSTDDVTSLRKSPSITTPKYTLKRSRSNISAELPSYKRNNENSMLEGRDVILEENELEHLDES